MAKNLNLYSLDQHRFSKTLVTFLLIFIFGSSFALGGTTGKVTGVVIDQTTGEPLIGSNVILEGTILGAATDLKGRYFILNIPPGTYSIKATMIGYRSTKVSDVSVSVDFTTRVDFELATSVLELGGVEVIATTPIIKKDLTSTRAVIGAETISEMPVESFDEILELQAGIVRGSDNKIHIRGGRASEIIYLIDGIPVNDPFSNEISVEVDNDAIQELQVISGTFNAEYGRAMSGVVDIVTKDGGRKLSGNISGFLGEYISADDEIFPNIDNLNYNGLTNVQATLGGPLPVLGDKWSFFTSGRRYENEGWLYGQRLVTTGFLDTLDVWTVEEGDGEFVPMNSFLKKSAQGKLTYSRSAKVKLSYSAFWNKLDNRVYDHLFRFNPDGDYRQEKTGLTQIAALNHSLSSRTFYTLKLSLNTSSFKRSVFDDSIELFDQTHIDSLDQNDIDSLLDLNRNYKDVESYKGRLYDGGTKLWNLDRNTTSTSGKFDITSQVTYNHQIKTGIEVRSHKLKFDEFKVLLNAGTGFLPVAAVDVPGNVNFNKYEHSPLEASVYFQDKMEFDDLIINIGIRGEYFDPSGRIPLDKRDPDNAKFYHIASEDATALRIPERDFDPDIHTIIDSVDTQDVPWVVKYGEASSSYSFSPRIGLAYPITDRSVMHFSYGHFSQIPPFKFLYQNSDFEVRRGPLNKDEGKGVFDRIYSADPEAEGNLMGNAALKSQRTINYELGIQQQISENIGVDITGFYKDMRNLLGTEIVEMYDTRLYARYVNRDVGNVRGITIAFNKRRSNHVSLTVDYTFQIAEGNASDPNDAFLDAISGRESEIRVVPLDWDQTHTLNTNITIVFKKSWGASLLGKLGSGLPYTFTPAQAGAQFTRFENNERRPSQITFDLNAHKDLVVGGMQGSIFIKVFNLLDRRNEVAVYNDTGRSGYTIRTQFWGERTDIGAVEDWVNRPHMYSQPRRIQLGIRLGF